MAYKARRSTAKVIAKNVQKNWFSATAATLPNKNVKEERLPVLVGNATDVKLLGVAKYDTGSDLSSGDIIAEYTCDLLQSWNCKTEHATLMLFLIVIKKGDQLLWNVIQYFILVLKTLKYFVLAFKLNF